MIILSWVFALAAIAVQSLSIVLTVENIRFKKTSSQVVLLPCFLWWSGAMLRDQGFFISSKLKEMLIVVTVHIALSLFLEFFRKIASK